MRYPLFSSVLIVALLSSCRSERPLGKVAGRVTFRGQPVREGSVVFSDTVQGLTFFSNLNAEGEFVFEVARGYGLPPSTYKVSIQPPMPKASLEYVAPDYSNKTYPDIPEIYRSEVTSGFTAVVNAGDNPPYVFDMK